MPRAHSVRRATLFTSGGRVFTRTKIIDILNIVSVAALGVWGQKWKPRARVYRASAMSMLFTVVTR